MALEKGCALSVVIDQKPLLSRPLQPSQDFHQILLEMSVLVGAIKFQGNSNVCKTLTKGGTSFAPHPENRIVLSPVALAVLQRNLRFSDSSTTVDKVGSQSVGVGGV